MTEWAHIDRKDVVAIGVDPQASGLLNVQIQLSRLPEDEWAEFFARPSGVPISLAMHPPRLEGSTVHIRPPDEDVEAYVRHVDERIANANARYKSEVLPRLHRAVAQRQEKQRRIDDAQRRVKKV